MLVREPALEASLGRRGERGGGDLRVDDVLADGGEDRRAEGYPLFDLCVSVAIRLHFGGLLGRLELD